MLSLSLRSATDTLPLDGLVSGEAGVQATSGALGFGLPPLAHQWVEGAGHGATHRGYRALSRTIDLPLTIEAPTRQELRAVLRRLSLILAGPATLRAHDSVDGSMWDLEVVRSGGGDYTYGADTVGETSLDMIVTLTAGDPFWTRVDQSSFLVETPNPGQGLLPHLARLTLAGSQAFGTRVVENPGDVETYPVWTVEGPGKNFEAKSAKGETLRWTGSLKVNETLHLDFGKGTVVDGKGVNRYSELAPAPRFFPIQPGTSEVSVRIDEASPGTLTPIRDIRTNLVSNPLPSGAVGSAPADYTGFGTFTVATEDGDPAIVMNKLTPSGEGGLVGIYPRGPLANERYAAKFGETWRLTAEVKAIRPCTARADLTTYGANNQTDSSSSSIALTPDMGWRTIEVDNVVADGTIDARPIVYTSVSGERNVAPDAVLDTPAHAAVKATGGSFLLTRDLVYSVGKSSVMVITSDSTLNSGIEQQGIKVYPGFLAGFAAAIAFEQYSSMYSLRITFLDSAGAVISVHEDWRHNQDRYGYRKFERRQLVVPTPAGAATMNVGVVVREDATTPAIRDTVFQTDAWDVVAMRGGAISDFYYTFLRERLNTFTLPDTGPAMFIRRMVLQKAEDPLALNGGFFSGDSIPTEGRMYRWEGTGRARVSIESQASISGVTRITCAWRPRAWTVI